MYPIQLTYYLQSPYVYSKLLRFNNIRRFFWRGEVKLTPSPSDFFNNLIWKKGLNSKLLTV